MVATCSVLLLLAAADAVPAAAQPVLSSSSTVRMVKFFLNTPTAELPPEAVPDFLAVDPNSLPKKLQAPYAGKREELLALKKIAEGKRKPPLRRLGVDEVPACEDLDPAHEGILLKAGYGKIEIGAVPFLMKETDCTECELQYEFTMRRVRVPPKKPGGKPDFRYFLHENDPLMAVVGLYNNGGKSAFGTNFFGRGHPKCR